MRRRGIVFKNFKVIDSKDELVVALSKLNENLKLVLELLADLRVNTSDDPKKAANEADVLYTDVWASMGKEHEREKRTKVFKKFQLNKAMVKLAKKDCIIMHCLPAHRGEEITDEIMESKNSIVFLQAENRLHTAKAIMLCLLGGKL